MRILPLVAFALLVSSTAQAVPFVFGHVDFDALRLESSNLGTLCDNDAGAPCGSGRITFRYKAELDYYIDTDFVTLGSYQLGDHLGPGVTLYRDSGLIFDDALAFDDAHFWYQFLDLSYGFFFGDDEHYWLLEFASVGDVVLDPSPAIGAQFPVPEPSSVLLMLAGLLAFAGFSRSGAGRRP